MAKAVESGVHANFNSGSAHNCMGKMLIRSTNKKIIMNVVLGDLKCKNSE